jgi:hypothetical protein
VGARANIAVANTARSIALDPDISLRMVTERFIAESCVQERAPRCVRLGKCEQDIRFSLL